MDAMDDLYAVLGLDRKLEISQEAIRRAYRVKVLACHPDKRRGDTQAAAAEFLRVKEAFDVLGVEASRIKYDILHGIRVKKVVPSIFSQCNMQANYFTPKGASSVNSTVYDGKRMFDFQNLNSNYF